MLYLFLHPFTSITDSFDQLIEQLPLVIQNRILRKKQQKKRESSLLGYTLLQQALIQYFDTNLETITFLPSGKPILKAANQSLSFNISHSKNLVGLVIGEGNTLGLDIEAFRKFDKVESSFSFFSLVEQEAILAAPNPDWKLIEFWSKKEALVKAVGGKMFDMAAYTDIRFETALWKGKTYQLSCIDYDFEGFIWIASLLSINNVNIKTIHDFNII
ncbi:MAG: 4'-phosphopantetheinyl transferase superfamily protein [Aureispira sp.]|nr:4'-phosphopantetheinyl transferase superfamily protein [Aureispira sp.]